MAPRVSPWVPVLGDAHVSELGARFLADRAVFAIEGRFDATEGDRRVVTLDYADQPVAAPWVFDDLAVEVARFTPLVEPDEVSVIARRQGQLVEYRGTGAPMTITSGNMRQFASAPVAGGHIIIAHNTLEEVVGIYQPYGQPRTEVSLGMSTDQGRVAAAASGDGTLSSEGMLLTGDGTQLAGFRVTTAPFSVDSKTALATMPCPITGISVTPRTSGALVTVACDTLLIFGTVTPAMIWQQHAMIDAGARAESVDLATLVTDDMADVVIQTDSLTVVPVLIHYRVDLASGAVEPGVVLTDGVQRFGRQLLARAADGGTRVYALRTEPGSIRLVAASLQDLLDNGIPEP